MGRADVAIICEFSEHLQYTAVNMCLAKNIHRYYEILTNPQYYLVIFKDFLFSAKKQIEDYG